MHSRRDFLKTGSAALVYGSTLLRGGRLAAEPLGLPLGLQLYSVRELLPGDFEGVLKQIGALGYRQVEAAGFFNHNASQVKQAMQGAGLHCVSAHYPFPALQAQFDEILAFNKDLGVEYLICASPGFKQPGPAVAHRGVRPMTLDDWKWNAEQFNKIGEKVGAAGLKFGYHNHIMEMHKIDGFVPYDELMRLTDPSHVTMEMDCGWVVVGGGNPIDFLQRYPTRISMLHIKDFKQLDPPKVCELGQGVIHYGPIFQAAAKTGNVKHMFVEQEAFDMPPFQALKVDADYMKKFKS
ncbi:MAG: sugar phosphate isomerase/epimerase family protein [Acidobacteriaceae bacterium]